MKALKSLFEKSEIGFALTWIGAYCVLMSVGDSLSVMIGLEKSVTLAVGLLLSAVLICFLKKNNLFEDYGLCRSQAKIGSMLYYLPVLVMLSANFWYGVKLNYGVTETLLYILSMICVGFLEELIFRGLLFNAMRKTNFKVAVIVSSVTFGIGHIINLVNGSGMDLIPNLLQVVYATSAGFMFVMMYCKEKSLITCIITHSLFNGVSAFANEASATNEMRVISCILLTLITGAYASYLAFTLKSNSRSNLNKPIKTKKD